MHKRAIAAAHHSGASHVMGAHLSTENYLATELPKTMSYTAIREGLYSELSSVYLAMFDLRKPVDEITIPHSGSGPGIAWAKRDELGEATARMIVAYVRTQKGSVILIRWCSCLGHGRYRWRKP
jgi:hypothetical protein